MLRALSANDKQDMLNLFKSIEQTFAPYWDEYPPFKTLKQRIANTRDILSQSNAGDSKGLNTLYHRTKQFKLTLYN